MIIGLVGYIAYDKGKNSQTKANEKQVEEQKEKEKIKETKNTLGEEEALTLGNTLWKYAYDTYWGRESVYTNRYNNGTKTICEPSIEEVKKKYTSDFTVASSIGGEEMEETSEEAYFFKEEYCEGAGRGSDQMYKTTSLKVKTIEENQIEYIATSEYCSSSFCHESNETTETKEKPFILKKVNNEWLISYFFLPN